MSRKPKIISRIKEPNDPTVGTGIQITWDDDTISMLGSGLLRRRCPCADCEELRAKEKVKKKAISESLRVLSSDIMHQTNIVEIKRVGNYAISILWGDGHSNGIYTFEYLQSLSEFIKI